jgi:predicted methyltransferase
MQQSAAAAIAAHARCAWTFFWCRRRTALMSVMEKSVFGCAVVVLLACGSVQVRAQQPDVGALVDKALAGDHRSERNRARDVHRHPRETLVFFGLRPDMHVAEVWPGGGWYTEVLAPVLRDAGRYYAAHYHINDNTHRYYRSSQREFVEKLAKRPDVYDKVVVTGLLPPHLDMAPKGMLDLVLTFRNVHNWTQEGFDAQMFRAFFDALKPGGVLGVVEHRAQDGTTLADMKRSGYMTEAYVIKLAQAAGFRLEAKSEVNANPRDTKDHPRGVWTLPPSLRLGDTDRAKYLAIGESDRMTLKFVKP